MHVSREEIAEFYLLGLRLKRLSVSAVVAWADSEILASDAADKTIIDLSLAALRSRDQVMDLLREIAGFPPALDGGLRLFGALLAKELNAGRLTTSEIAGTLYGLTSLAPHATRVFGEDIYWLEDLFEAYMPDQNAGDAQVRELLKKFSSEILPPI